MGTERATHHRFTLSVVAFALLLFWALPTQARMELIGFIDGQAVILIWGNECSALDPPNDNVARIEVTYVGPPQPGVFGEVTLVPPFDSFLTDGATFLTVFASDPAPLPCPTCYEPAAFFETSVDLGDPGEDTPFNWVEFNAVEGSCSGVALHGTVSLVPSQPTWALILLAATIVAMGAIYVRRRPKLPVR